jgi:methyl-accepting chemotaxis protein
MVMAMENINTRAHEIQESTGRQRGEGDRILQQIEKMRLYTSQVVDATELQSHSSHKILEKMASIGMIAEANARNSNDVQKRSENLVQAVATLERMISQFSLTNDKGRQAKGLALAEEEMPHRR